MTDADPVTGRQTIAYATRLSFYEMMVTDLCGKRHEDFVSVRTFYRILSVHFPEIEFVKVLTFFLL